MGDGAFAKRWFGEVIAVRSDIGEPQEALGLCIAKDCPALRQTQDVTYVTEHDLAGKICEGRNAWDVAVERANVLNERDRAMSRALAYVGMPAASAGALAIASRGVASRTSIALLGTALLSSATKSYFTAVGDGESGNPCVWDFRTKLSVGVATYYDVQGTVATAGVSVLAGIGSKSMLIAGLAGGAATLLTEWSNEVRGRLSAGLAARLFWQK